MHQRLASLEFPQDLVHPLHGIRCCSTLHNRKIDVLEAGGADDGRLIEGAGLHGIAVVDDDFAAGGFEIAQLLFGGLPPGHPARDGLGGVGETGYGREKIRQGKDQRANKRWRSIVHSMKNQYERYPCNL